jgi:hypothetical protein
MEQIKTTCLECGTIEPLFEADDSDGGAPSEWVPSHQIAHGNVIWCFTCEGWRVAAQDEGGHWVLRVLPANHPDASERGYPPPPPAIRASFRSELDSLNRP